MKNSKMLPLLLTIIFMVIAMGGGYLLNRNKVKEEQEAQIKQEQEAEAKEKQEQEEQAKKEQKEEDAKKDIKSYVAYLDNENITYDKSTDYVIIKSKFSESLSSVFKGTNAETIEKRLQQTRYNYTRDLKQFKDVKEQPKAYAVKCYTDTVDKYGNKGNDIVMTFEIKGSELKKINFDNVYTIEDLGVEIFTDLYYSAYNE
ncbi:hypothetical protein J0L31_12090 [Terrisporobacter glycolicus]|nr:hypothetical protein [Terrisporobacter glycolicus]